MCVHTPILRVRLCARPFRRGVCMINCKFSEFAAAFKIKLALKSPLPPALPSPLPILSFISRPHSLSPFLAQRESLEKKRGFYSASLCAPRHSQAFWNLSMPCQGAPRVQLALCEDFLSAAAPLPLLLQRQRGRTVFSRGFPVTTGCNN